MLVFAGCCFVLVLLLVPLCFIGVFWLCSLLLYLFMLVLVLFFPGKTKQNKQIQPRNEPHGRALVCFVLLWVASCFFVVLLCFWLLACLMCFASVLFYCCFCFYLFNISQEFKENTSVSR